MNRLLQEAPFLKLLPPFMLGILAAVYALVPLSWNYSPLLLSGLLLFILMLFNPKLAQRRSLTWFIPLLAYLLLFFSGIQLTALHSELLSEQHFSKHTTDKSSLQLRITEPIQDKGGVYEIRGEVNAVNAGDSAYAVSGKVLLFLDKSGEAANLKYGDVVWIKTQAEEVSEVKNPGSFDYKKSMAYKQYHHQVFARDGEWELLPENRGSRFFTSIYRIRNQLKELLYQYIDDYDALAVASSILLGMKDHLDDELMQAYAGSGVMHILAVSGLHVGIIYLLLHYLLRFPKHSKRWQLSKVFIILACIWLYACITGLYPSILRASVMFSAITIGDSMNRRPSIYNTLGASAFLLLLFNPYILMEPGFQLSYMAVLGIVSLQPVIYKKLYFRSWLADKMWMLFAASLAAQLATFPLVMFYFHQLPIVFFISNLLAIPLAIFIMYGGFFLFAFAWLKVIAVVTGNLLNNIISFCNKSFAWLEKLPFTTWKELFIFPYEVFLLYAFIITLMLALKWRNGRWLQASLLLLVVVLGGRFVQTYSQLHQSQLVVYHVSDTQALGLVAGKQHRLISDDEDILKDTGLRQPMENYWWANGLSVPEQEKVKVYKKDKLLLFAGKKILLLDEPIPQIDVRDKLKLDYIIISNSQDISMEAVNSLYHFEQLIFDTSNDTRNVNLWKKECEALCIACYDVKESGAFIAKLR